MSDSHSVEPAENAPAPSASGSRAPAASRGAAWLIARLGPLVGLAFVIALFGILRPQKFLTVDNFQTMLLQTTVVATMALGMTMIIISGGIDLSIGSNVALCSVAVAVMLDAGVGPIFAALGGVALGSLAGLLIGLLITRLNLQPFIVTLGMWGALRGAAKGLAHERTVSAPVTWLNDLLDPRHGILFPPGVWLMLGLTIAVAAMLRYTRLGRHIVAIGSNEQTARLCGVAVERTKLLTYGLGLALAGVAGVLQFSNLTVGDPTTASGYELKAIAAVVIGGGSLAGGEGSVFGSVIGALIMTFVDNGCNKMNMPNWVQEIVTGAIIIVAVSLDQLRRRGRR
jgi:ribose/xylose/arabinose/galactoside ABC-type transport system permease subunit